MTREELIDRFVDFLIEENCEGCTECDPKLSEDCAAVFCCEQGRANWLMSMGEVFKYEIGKIESRDKE